MVLKSLEESPDGPDVILIDPKNGENVKFKRDVFESVWHGGAVLIVRQFPEQDIIKRYSTGRIVGDLQGKLHRLGFFSDQMDSVYGPKTIASVKALQKSVGLQADGMVGAVTHLALADFFAALETPRLAGVFPKQRILLNNIEALIKSQDYERAGAVMSTLEKLDVSLNEKMQQEIAAIYELISKYQAYTDMYDQGVRAQREGRSNEAIELFSQARNMAQNIVYHKGVQMAETAMKEASMGRRRPSQPNPTSLTEEMDWVDASINTGLSRSLDHFYDDVERAMSQFKAGETERAIQILQEAQTPRQHSGRILRSRNWNEEARFDLITAMRDGDPKKVNEVAARILEVRMPVADESFYTLFRQGIMYVRSGDLKRAAEFFEQARIQALQDGLYRDASACDRILAKINDVLDRPRMALDAYERKGKYLRRRIEQIPGIESVLADILRDQGRLLLRTGQHEAAVKALIEARRIYKKFGNRESVAELAVTIGEIQVLQNRLDEADRMALEAAQYYRSVSNAAGLIRVEVLKGKIARSKGQYAEAIRHFETASTLSRNAGLDRYNARIMEGLGDIWVLMNSPEKALYYFDKAREYDNALGKLREQAADLNNIGLVCYRFDISHRGKGPKEWLEKSLAINESVHNEKAKATNLLNLAAWHADHGEYTKAESLLKDAIKIRKEIFGDNHPSVGVAVGNLASIYAEKGNYAAAMPRFQLALGIAVNAGQMEMAWPIQGGISKALSKQEQTDAAIFFGKEAVNTIQSMRSQISGMGKTAQESFLKDKESVYRQLADLLIRRGRIPEAQQVLAMLKQEEYFDFVRRNASGDDLAGNSKASYNPFEKKWSDHYLEISNRIVAIGRELSSMTRTMPSKRSEAEKARIRLLRNELNTAYQAFQQTLEEIITAFDKLDREHYAELTRKQLDTDLRGLVKELGHGAVLIHYIMLQDELHIILTTPDVLVTRKAAVSTEELNQMLMSLRSRLQNPSIDSRPAARALYQYLISPISEDLKQADAKMLMVSLDGALRYLPIAVLYDGSRYLIEDYSVAVFTEASRDKIKDIPGHNWTLAGLGVSRAIQGFNPLPAVPDELEGVIRKDSKDLDGVLPGIIRLDEAFDREALLDAMEYPALHIASHFQFKPGNGLSSFLLLGDGDRLSLAEIHRGDYNLSAVELITLSACETAVGGRQTNGREVEGLGALVQKKGAKSVLATLWPVADQSTGILMKNLYSLYEGNPGITKAEALRRAQLLFLRGELADANPTETSGRGKVLALKPGSPSQGDSDTPDTDAPYAHPYYWAPFILMGNWL